MHRFAHLLQIALACLALLVFASSASAFARPGIAAHDADQDGWYDEFESATGSSPTDFSKTPESVATAAIPDQQPYLPAETPSCKDGVDNDKDGMVDSNAGNPDPGCDPPPVSTSLTSGGFTSALHAEIAALDVPLPFPGTPHCTVGFTGDGGAVVTLGAPSGGSASGEITAAQLDGVATFIATPGCPLPAGYKTNVQVLEDPAVVSTASVTDNNPSPVDDFPATSEVDFHAIVISVAGIAPLSGPPLENGNVTQTPPYCLVSCDPNNPVNDCYDDGLGLSMCLTPPPADPVVGVDHFKQYLIKAPKFAAQTVTLDDAYGPQQTGVIVKKPTSAATPVKLTPPGDPILDPDAHLKCYQVKAPALPKPYPTVTTGDAFGHRVLSLTKRTSLCVPTQKLPQPAPVGLDSFECYKVKSLTPQGKLSAGLEDQFGTQNPVGLSTITSFCAPVSVNGEPVPNPASHLTCYKITKATPKFTPIAKDLDDRFGLEAGVQFKKPSQLCTATSKS
jgi:hypothetical protein